MLGIITNDKKIVNKLLPCTINYKDCFLKEKT